MKRSNNIRRIALYGFLLVLVLASCISTVLSKYTSDVESAKSKIYVTAGSIDLSASNDVNGLVVIPGTYLALTEQPFISVENSSESCFVFLKITTSDDVKEIMKITCDTEWKLLDGYTNVYYREFTKNAGANSTTYNVFSDYSKAIWVSSTATKAQIDAISDDNITFTAYAVQKTPHITDADTAWEALLESRSS